jgi:hypothetical protein
VARGVPSGLYGICAPTAAEEGVLGKNDGNEGTEPVADEACGGGES